MNKLVCELCGSNDFTKDNDGLFACDFCRTKYTPDQAKSMMVEGTVRVDRTDEAKNFLTLSDQCMRARSYQEAFSYAARALEIDPGSVAGWFLKGVAAGRLSSFETPRVAEMVSSLEIAIEKAGDRDREEVRGRCAQEANSVGIACRNLSNAWIADAGADPDHWGKNVSLNKQAISAFQWSYFWRPSRPALDNLMEAARTLIAGVPYKYFDPGRGSYRSGSLQVPPAEVAELQGLIARTAAEIRKFDPSYTLAKPRKRSRFRRD